MSSFTRRALTMTSVATFGLVACGAARPNDSAGSIAPPRVPAPAGRFPISIAPGKRYLQDASGRPFLLHGDSAWSLIAQLSREDAALYLDDRQARGFNTVLVNLIEHRFATNPPYNFYGVRPFGIRDFRDPIDAYFDYAEEIVEACAARGLLVALAPAYTGGLGGIEGFWQEMVRAGEERLYAYGRYVGARFAKHPNILWVHGGDYNPPDLDLVRAIVRGIRAFDTRSLNTAHCTSETAPVDLYTHDPWLTVNNVYTYGPVFKEALAQYQNPMPFFFAESAYENEHGAGERRVRTEAYQALLCGACGDLFGNAPIWHFSTRGMTGGDWRGALNSAGAQSMTHLKALFDGVDWPQLVPDVGNTLLLEGRGDDDDCAVAASAADRSFALAYAPSARGLTINLARLSGALSARWYDVSNGTFQEISGLFPASGRRVFQTPGANAGGDADWVLLIQRAPA